jgi:lysophospholipase L1-like esterase
VRRMLLGAVSLMLAALVTAALLEGAVRLLHLAPPLMLAYWDNVPDAHIPFKRRPGSVLRGRWPTGEFDYEFRHNALGFRDIEHPEEKPAGTFRILFLGDSFTYGAGADFDSTWPSVVERKLNERSGSHPRVEAIRMGLPRYFPAAEREVLDFYGLRFAPDLVLVGILPNDVIDTHYGLGAIQLDREGTLRTPESQALGEVGRWLYVHSQAMRIVLGRIVAVLRQHRDPIFWEDVYHKNGRHERDWLKMEADLEGMSDDARAAGAQLVLVSIPQRGPWDETHLYPDRRLAAWSAAHGVPFIATAPSLEKAATEGPVYWSRDGHCTPRGYAAIGSAVVGALVERGLVP